jgi:hypothetical protein
MRGENPGWEILVDVVNFGTKGWHVVMLLALDIEQFNMLSGVVHEMILGADAILRHRGFGFK